MFWRCHCFFWCSRGSSSSSFRPSTLRNRGSRGSTVSCIDFWPLICTTDSLWRRLVLCHQSHPPLMVPCYSISDFSSLSVMFAEEEHDPNFFFAADIHSAEKFRKLSISANDEIWTVDAGQKYARASLQNSSIRIRMDHVFASDANWHTFATITPTWAYQFGARHFSTNGRTCSA